MSSIIIHLVLSMASLLSGGLSDCKNATDPSCKEGVAAVSAFLRHHHEHPSSNNANASSSSLVVPNFDKQHPFVQMHPLGWSVNRVVLHDIMGWDFFLSGHSILLQNHVDYNVSKRDISDLQSKQMPLLLTNAAIPPGNSWFPFVEQVHLDYETGIALMNVDDGANVLTQQPQIESVFGVLNYVARLNAQQAECSTNSSTTSLYQLKYQPENATTNQQQQRCWMPVIYYQDIKRHLLELIDAVSKHEHPPALIIDADFSAGDLFSQPVLNGATWVVSVPVDPDLYHELRLEVVESRIESLQVIEQDLDPIPESYKDETYARHIDAIASLAKEAELNNPVVGFSHFLPWSRRYDATWASTRPCQAGECPVGNLFADALRWKAATDIAFVTSGGLRGPGWEAGAVQVSDIWACLPFPNTLCQGTLSGISLFQLVNYSISVAEFEGEDTEDGGRLLQLSGMRMIYNTLMNKTARVVGIEIWNEQEGMYQPIDRLKMYTFATDSFLCGGYDPYPKLLQGSKIAGEQPGQIGEALVQNIVGEFLGQYTDTEPYDPSIQGKHVNDTSATVAMNLVQSEDECQPGTYWSPDQLSCLQCPSVDVLFLEDLLEFQGESGVDNATYGRNILLNRDNFTVGFAPKAVPEWVQLTSVVEKKTATTTSIVHEQIDVTSTTLLKPGETIDLSVQANAVSQEAGTAHSVVSFGVVTAGGSYPGCVGQDAQFEVLLRVAPPPSLNHLGMILRAVGFALLGVCAATATFFAVWVLFNRNLAILKTLQPNFLIAICLGALTISAAIAPMSIDDEIVSVESCSKACMATPWLLSMGFTVTMSALFTKLWRINKLFNATQFRKRQVREKDVMAPFLILFTVNFILLVTWTVVDPLKWERLPIKGEPWNTVGTCSLGGSAAKSMLALVVLVNAGALGMACYQAYKARNISDQFSEAKNLGITLICWVQMALVGFPVLFLIDRDNPTARYFLNIALIFAACMSLLLIIFVPLLLQHRNALREEANAGTPAVQLTDRYSHYSCTEQAPNSGCSVVFTNRGRAPSADSSDSLGRHSLRGGAAASRSGSIYVSGLNLGGVDTAPSKSFAGTGWSFGVGATDIERAAASVRVGAFLTEDYSDDEDARSSRGPTTSMPRRGRKRSAVKNQGMASAPVSTTTSLCGSEHSAASAPPPSSSTISEPNGSFTATTLAAAVRRLVGDNCRTNREEEDDENAKAMSSLVVNNSNEQEALMSSPAVVVQVPSSAAQQQDDDPEAPLVEENPLMSDSPSQSPPPPLDCSSVSFSEVGIDDSHKSSDYKKPVKGVLVHL